MNLNFETLRIASLFQAQNESFFMPSRIVRFSFESSDKSLSEGEIDQIEDQIEAKIKESYGDVARFVESKDPKVRPPNIGLKGVATALEIVCKQITKFEKKLKRDEELTYSELEEIGLVEVEKKYSQLANEVAGGTNTVNRLILEALEEKRNILKQAKEKMDS